MTHIHSRFSDEQLKLLIRSYEEGQMSPAQDLNFLLGLTSNPILRDLAADLAKEGERRFLKERTPVHFSLIILGTFGL